MSRVRSSKKRIATDDALETSSLSSSESSPPRAKRQKREPTFKGAGNDVAAQDSALARAEKAETELIKTLTRAETAQSQAEKVGRELIDTLTRAEKAEAYAQSLVLELRETKYMLLREMRGREKNKIVVLVKHPDGRMIVLRVFSDEDIGNLKFRVYMEENIPVDQQRLIMGGKQLIDHQTLSECGIANESTVHLVYRLRGS